MLFSHKYRYIFVLFLGLYSYLNTVLTGVFDYYPITAPQSYIIAIFVGITLLIWEGNRFLQYFFEEILKTQKVFFGGKVHPLVLQFLISLSVAGFAGIFPTFFIGKFLLNFSTEMLLLSIKLTFAFSLRVNLFLHCLNIIAYFVEQYQQKKIETEKLIKTTTQAQLQSLRSQINPHFLFNNLNVLSALILKDTENANEFVEKFAKVYRYVLKSQEKELVPVAEELTFIESYCYLLLKRFGNSVKVEINIPEKFLSCYIVPIALQMLVENAIKHNIVSQKQPLFIHIYVENENQTSKIVVSNSLQKKVLPENNSTQLGLYNVAQRYQLLNKNEIEIIENKDFFVVKLPLITTKSY